MRKIIFKILPVLLLVFVCTGCSSTSLKLEPSAKHIQTQAMPVKFKFDTISWSDSSSLPSWFSKDKISQFINLMKARSPELFSDDPQALPLTFHFTYKNKPNNNGLILLSLCTFFTIIPAVMPSDHQFDLKIEVGYSDDQKYEEQNSFVIKERTYISLIPFFALILPAQSGKMCDAIGIVDEAINAPELQNTFLNMIYRLDKDKLRRIYDRKYGEKIELIGAEEEM